MAYSIDGSKKISVANTLESISRSAAGNGTGVDCRGYESIVLELRVGLLTTGPTATFAWEESDDNSAFTAIATANLSGGALPAITTSNDNASYIRGYLGNKRYVRCALTVLDGGTILSSANVIRALASREPVTQG